MSLSTMNQAQMMVLESFASINSAEELNSLMSVLRSFYAKRLDAELERLWDNGTLNQATLDEMREQHFRTSYRGQA